MKSYTKSSIWNGSKIKYPVISQDTGNTYEVVIHPYGRVESGYAQGCIVTLKKKKWFISDPLITKYFSNNLGKIDIEYFGSHEITKTEIDYNLIGVSQLAVKLYEAKEEQQIKSVSQLDKDFDEFSKWDGIV